MSIRPTLVLVPAVILAVTLEAAPPAGKNAPIPVTVMLADSQNGFPLRVGSDTQGPYLDTSKALNAEIHRYSDGTDWMLTTYYGIRNTPSSRSVFFDLTEQVTSGVPPIAAASVQAHLIAKCRLAFVDLLTLATGASADCPGSFRFQAPSGKWYRFSFQPDNFPGVDRLRLTCLARDAAGCKTWTVTPATDRVTSADPNPKGLQTLLEIENGSDDILAVLGDYYLSFHITVTR